LAEDEKQEIDVTTYPSFNSLEVSAGEVVKMMFFTATPPFRMALGLRQLPFYLKGFRKTILNN